MVSNLIDNQEYVYCKEHNRMIHRDNAKLLMQAANRREQEQQAAINQVDTMISFSLGSNAPSYLPRKDKNMKQAGFTDKPAPKNSDTFPSMTETLLEFAGLR